MRGTVMDEVSACGGVGTDKAGLTSVGLAQRAVTDKISAINEAIADKVGPQKYRIWFKHSIKLTLTDGYLKVGVPNLFIAGWIENHF